MGRASRRHRARSRKVSSASASSVVDGVELIDPAHPPCAPGLDLFYRRLLAEAAPADAFEDLRKTALGCGFAAPSVARVPDPGCCVPVHHRVDIAGKHPLLRHRVLGLVLLAPCTRHAAADDPDVRAVIPHARHFGFGFIEVRWLFGVPVTCSAQLASFADPVRPGTDAALDELAGCDLIVAAWGDGDGVIEDLLCPRGWAVGTRLARLSGRSLRSLKTGYGYPYLPSNVEGRILRLVSFAPKRPLATVKPRAGGAVRRCSDEPHPSSGEPSGTPLQLALAISGDAS